MQEKRLYKSPQQPNTRFYSPPATNIMCHDILIEPTLQQLTGKSLHERNANITDEVLVDIVARGFWISGERAFFDINKGI